MTVIPKRMKKSERIGINKNYKNIFQISIPAIRTEIKRRKIIPPPWTYRSSLIRKLFFFVKRLANAMTPVDTSRPPSSAGNGRRLRTQRLIERSAMMENIIFHVTQTCTTSTKVDPIPIGPESIAVASVLSVVVCGDMSFLRVLPRTSSVIRESAYVSETARVRDSPIVKFSWYSLSRMILL